MKLISRSFVYVACVILGPAAIAAPPAGGPPGNLSAAVAELQEMVAEQEEQIAALEALLAGVSRGIDPNTGYDTIQFSGMNLQVVNGTGTTQSTNGTGNLILGYNELRDEWNPRDGSHMLVIGGANNYTENSYAGMVVGWSNETDAPFASIIALGSWVDAYGAHVLGGINNRAHGPVATVSGGDGNAAFGQASSITGGEWNSATGDYASVTGGEGNMASGNYSWASGGDGNLATGDYSSVSGGVGNIASGGNASVSGGAWNTASGGHTSISGGDGNTASGFSSSVSGGYHRIVEGDYDWAAGSLWEDN